MLLFLKQQDLNLYVKIQIPPGYPHTLPYSEVLAIGPIT